MALELSRRDEFHLLLAEVLGSANVYFQAPPDNMMSYPAIVYERDAANAKHANNTPYYRAQRYQVTVMDLDPDGFIANRVGALPTSSFERKFNVNGLNHDVYTIYF